MRNHSTCRRCGIGILLVLMATLAQAYGPRGGHGYRYGGWGYDPWIAPLVFGAAVGSTMYFSRPYPAVPGSTVIITNPPAVIMQNPSGGTGAAPVEAYYCRETAQYFPVVQTCVSPWLVVNPH